MIIPEKTIKNLEIALKVRRKEHHLTQESLSDMTGISKRHITKIENEIANASFEIISILAKCLDISIDQIIFSDLDEAEEYIKNLLSNYQCVMMNKDN
ncbi:helix-turn-helix domain-containing protein [Thomasclavelia saccharogumia]|uniref:helix-turn-helix domain-containing protein n=1 Tax=Thomasclavelia saccharogumia TaxID=341225 RepID=UPI0005520F44|nr:helix-turn-helix transcriptional regulator [Thomasclavelia saccharogumia]